MSRPVLVSVLCAALVAGVSGGCDRGPEEPAQDGAQSAKVATAAQSGEVIRDYSGTPLPAMTLSDPDGKTLDLSAIEGPILVNFWATWCAPCVVEMPMLDTLASELDGEVRVLTISQDLRGAEVVTPFFAERDFANLEPWLDPQAELTDKFSENGQLPLTILFDGQGREMLRVSGAYAWDSEDAIALVREAVEQGARECGAADRATRASAS